MRNRLVGLTAVLALTMGGVGIGIGNEASPLEGDVVGLLLIGSDEGPARESDPLAGRADAFQIVFVRTDGSGATLISVPRDSYVRVPGHGEDRINTCLTYGPQRCVETVETLWGVDIDAWIVTGFWGFRDAIDGLGGVEMDVPSYLDGGGPPLEAGDDQLLDGPHALTWVRDRKHRPQGDLDRTVAQAELLVAAHAQLKEAARSPVRLAELARVVRRSTLTDLSGPDLVRLGVLAVRTEPADVRSVRLPARLGTAGAKSVVLLADEADHLIRGAADGR